MSLRVLTFVLIALSVAAVPLIALFLTSRGPIEVPVHVDPPYSIGLTGDRKLAMCSPRGDPCVYENFEFGQEKKFFKGPLTVSTNVHVAREDTDSKLVVSGFAVALLVVAWLGLTCLRRVVASARAGDPFDAQNIARLRVLALCIVMIPAVTQIAVRLLDHTLVDPSVSPVGGSNWWIYVVAALGVLALSEVFREGTSLRQLERETI